MAKRKSSETTPIAGEDFPPVPNGYKTAGGDFPEAVALREKGQWLEGRILERRRLDADNNQFGRENVVYHIHITAASDGLARPNETRSLFGTGLLNWRMASVPDGAAVQIVYLGKIAMRSGPFKGKEAHDYRIAYKAE